MAHGCLEFVGVTLVGNTIGAHHPIPVPYEAHIYICASCDQMSYRGILVQGTTKWLYRMKHIYIYVLLVTTHTQISDLCGCTRVSGARTPTLPGDRSMCFVCA
jgi:hypothetical protein